MRKSAYLIVLVLLGHLDLQAQMKGGVEQYFYLGDSGEETVVPVLHMQQKGGWYTEARYNYEEAKTFSLYSGRKFSHNKKLSWSMTPLIGFSAGELEASSAALEIEVNKNKIFLLAQSQFTVALDEQHTNFFFNWSELGYDISDFLYTGLTLQYTRQSGFTDMKPGLFAGVNLGRLSVPIYVFKPLVASRYLVIGLSYEYAAGRNRHTSN